MHIITPGVPVVTLYTLRHPVSNPLCSYIDVSSCGICALCTTQDTKDTGHNSSYNSKVTPYLTCQDIKL